MGPEMRELQYLREMFGNIGNRGREHAPGPLMPRDCDGRRGDPRRSNFRGGSGPRHGQPDVRQRDDRRRDFDRKDGTTTPTVMPPLSLYDYTQSQRHANEVGRFFEEHSKDYVQVFYILPTLTGKLAGHVVLRGCWHHARHNRKGIFFFFFFCLFVPPRLGRPQTNHRPINPSTRIPGSMGRWVPG